jgi:peptide subunit release factor 1 (eRF1)
VVDLLTRLRDARLEAPALSVYLPPGPALDRRYYLAALKQLDKERVPDQLDKAARCALDVELHRARRHLEQFHPAGKSVVMFSCEPAGLFESQQLPEDAGARLTFDTKLDLEPLVAMARKHPPALVVVADKMHARVFRVSLGELEEVAELEGDPVRRHKQGGWSDRRLQRHEDEWAEGNLRAAAEWIESFAPATLPLFVGGPPEARASFKRLLPKRRRQALAGEFSAQLTISTVQLAERLRAAG